MEEHTDAECHIIAGDTVECIEDYLSLFKGTLEKGARLVVVNVDANETIHAKDTNNVVWYLSSHSLALVHQRPHATPPSAATNIPRRNLIRD